MKRTLLLSFLTILTMALLLSFSGEQPKEAKPTKTESVVKSVKFFYNHAKGCYDSPAERDAAYNQDMYTLGFCHLIASADRWEGMFPNNIVHYCYDIAYW